jgi:hypothetical protein
MNKTLNSPINKPTRASTNNVVQLANKIFKHVSEGDGIAIASEALRTRIRNYNNNKARLEKEAKTLGLELDEDLQAKPIHEPDAISDDELIQSLTQEQKFSSTPQPEN